MTKFLVETALLTHGLTSISNEELLREWPFCEPCLAWMDAGELKIGTMAEFLPFRDRRDEIIRVNGETFESARAQKINGALTASGTMEAARRLGISLAVTCGMGGIGEIKGETLCPDLPALRDLPVVLIAATPKDVVNIAATVEWLRAAGVAMLGRETDRLSGFMAEGKPVPIDGQYVGQALCPPMLLLNPIPEKDRLTIPHAVEQAIAAGKEAERQGRPFHPAANAAFDRLSCGHSSRLQYHQLINNARWAAELTVNL